MKKLLAFLAIVFFVGQAGAQTTEYLQQKDFQAEKKKIYEGINASKKQLNEIKKADAKIKQSIDSIKLTLEMNAGQLVMNTDSLTKTSVKVNSLKEQFDGQKLLSRGLLILLFIVILILFIIVFIMLFLFKKKADTNHQSIVDLDKKTNERLDLQIKSLKGDMQSNLEAVTALSTELSHKISSTLISFEAKNQQLEKQLKEELYGIEAKFSTFGPEISKLKEDQSYATKSIEDKLNTLKRESDLINQGLTARAAKLEEDVKLLKGKQ
jgi:NADH:ubiquinone oxidoreductase subunit 3 (subunit A)